MINITKNRGLIEKVRDSDWELLGANNDIDNPILRMDGDWSSFLPEYEAQTGLYFGTQACVTFSALNNIEILLNRLIEIDNNVREELVDLNLIENGKVNASDRFNAKLSETTKRGNYYSKVADSIRKDGIVAESEYPFPRRQRTPVFDWDDYYKEIPDRLENLGESFKDKFKVNHFYFKSTGIEERLKYGPVQVGYRTAAPKKDGIYQRTDGRINHAITIYNRREDGVYEGFDHYEREEGDGKIYFAPDFKFGTNAYQYFIKLNKENNMILEENTMYQETEKTGAFGLYVRGKFIVDDSAKMLLTLLTRTQGDIVGRFKVLNKEQWDSLDKYDLSLNKK